MIKQLMYTYCEYKIFPFISASNRYLFDIGNNKKTYTSRNKCDENVAVLLV